MRPTSQPGLRRKDGDGQESSSAAVAPLRWEPSPLLWHQGLYEQEQLRRHWRQPRAEVGNRHGKHQRGPADDSRGREHGRGGRGFGFRWGKAEH